MLGKEWGDVLGAAGEREREMPGGGLVLHRGLDAFAIDERDARFMARRPIGAQPLDHLDVAGAVRRQPNVIADIEWGVGQKMFPCQLGQVQSASTIGGQQSEGPQRRRQHRRWALGQSKRVAEFRRRQR